MVQWGFSDVSSIIVVKLVMRVTNDAMANAGKPTSTIVKTIAVGESGLNRWRCIDAADVFAEWVRVFLSKGCLP